MMECTLVLEPTLMTSLFITVQVNGQLLNYFCSVIHENINAVIPEVEINTTDTLVGIGNNVTITCFVIRGNPSIYIYTITNVNTSSTTTVC